MIAAVAAVAAVPEASVVLEEQEAAAEATPLRFWHGTMEMARLCAMYF
jgi:hypothetical protein